MAARKMIVFGGNGFVGSEVTRVAIAHGWNVVVACRSGQPVGYQRKEEWAQKASFVKIDALQREQVCEFLDDHPDTDSIVNCIGLLTLNKRQARRVNGDPCLNIAAAMCERPKIGKLVFISAADMEPANQLLSGYYYGKRNAEKAMTENLGPRAAVLRPGFIYGPRALQHGMTLPLQLIGRPLELLLTPVHAILPLSILTPPVSVTTVAKAAVYCAEMPENTGIYEVAEIQKLAQTF
jgi:nucleoside-diphosphate-sugar epimerase